ncbi:MAG: protein kinase [Planctomycetota bacterium]
MTNRFVFPDDARALGKGVHGTVFLAHDKKLQRDVAIKFFGRTTDQVDHRIAHQARALIDVTHPNLVIVHSIEDVPHPQSELQTPVPALVMERLNGHTLREWASAPSRAIHEVIDIFSQVCDGLGALHAANYSHGDLHAANILVCDGKAKIIDPSSPALTALLTTLSPTDAIARDVRSLGLLAFEFLLPFLPDGSATAKRLLVASSSTTLDSLKQHIFSIASTPDENISDTSTLTNASCDPVPTTVPDIRRRLDVASKFVATQLGQWQSRWPNQPLNGKVDPKPIDDLVGSFEPMLDLCLRLAETPSADAEVSMRAIRLARSVRWPSSGYKAYTSIPGLFAHILYQSSIASAIQADHEMWITSALRLKIRDREFTNHRRNALDDDELQGWCKTFADGETTATWAYLERLYQLSPALQNTFTSLHAYQSHLVAARLILGFVDYVQLSSSTDDDGYIRPRVGPAYLFRYDDSTDVGDRLISAYDVLAESQGCLTAMYGFAFKDGIRDFWPRFIKNSLTWAHKVGPGYYSFVTDAVNLAP